MMSKKSIGNGLMVIGLIFILVGFKDSIYSYFARGVVDKETVQLLEEAINQGDKGDKEGKEGKEEIKETVWKEPSNKEEANKYREENNKEYDSKGVIVIPKINQRISVMNGVGGNNMFRGAGEQYLDMEMGKGNYVLASHRMKDGSLFSKLEQVELGDDMYITDYKTVWKYEVTTSDNKVETSRVGLLKDTVEPIMTVYGCTPDGVMRVVKQSKLVGYASIQDLSEEDKAIIMK